MEQFSLEKYLENPNREVVTRSGNPVRILCTDCGVMMSHPILTEIVCGGKAKVLEYHYIDGTTHNKNNDLFFADEEEESQSIEIPFGAKNSEFIRDEYYIPEGCEARIEGNKVIIERVQKEEELTKFKKALLAAFNCVAGKAVTTIGPASFQEDVDEWSKPLLDLARNELEKENPEFKPKFTYNEKDYSELANKLIEFRNNTPLCSVSYRDGEGRKVILHYEKEILDLAKKELEKDLPMWKKDDNHLSSGVYSIENRGDGNIVVCIKNYAIQLSELIQKLPKEE